MWLAYHSSLHGSTRSILDYTYINQLASYDSSPSSYNIVLKASVTPTITSYKSVSLILVSPLDPKVVATIDIVITSAFSSILFNFINTITR